MEETMKTRKRISAYPVIKWLSLFGMVVFTVIAASGLFVTLYMAEWNIYSLQSEKEQLDARFAVYAKMNVNEVIVNFRYADKNAAVDFLKSRNVAALEIESTKSGEKFCYWKNASVKDNLPGKYVYSGVDESQSVKWKVYVDPAFPVHTDNYYRDYELVTNAYKYRFAIPVLAGVAGLLSLICLIVFFSGIGRVPDSNEVTENYFTKIPFDAFTLILAAPALLCLLAAYASNNDDVAVVALLAIAVCGFLWLINAIHRIKLGNLFRNTLLANLCVLIYRGLKALFTNIPLLWKAILILLAVSVCEFLTIAITCVLCSAYDIGLLIGLAWFFEKIVVIPILLYLVLMMKRLFKGGSELAAGNTDYKIDVRPLIGEYRKHGENLNHLSDGINAAGEERMKSERMKTELVANVSHDIKTPLTSVINYSDLIGKEAEKTGDAVIAEYSEVLNRQSNRLKKLLEDLVEISKANSGNLDMIPEKLEIGTLLDQIIAEYEDKFAEKRLETVFSKPESEIYFMADSRKTGRILDNLMQNIYKYAYPGTRVFISAQTIEKKLCIQFKNTSCEKLTKTPEELLERFTRGDESRHKEGNGLGLAIAKSLTELQGGEMKVEIDGDLFKVILLMDELKEDIKEE